MFNKDFYPTPESVARKMIAPFRDKIHDIQILEPSAGKGDIPDSFTNNVYGRIRTDNIYCMEIEPELQMILKGKGYRVIGSDFLEYNGDYNFDLIVMNPPFSAGDEHLLKAWNILKNGDIACLLNAETINNPYTQKRQLLYTIIKENGEIENLGKVFKNAERKTDVETILVRLHKKTDKKVFNFDFKDSGFDYLKNIDSKEVVNNAVMRNDFIGTFIRQYEKTKESFVEYVEAKKKLQFFGQRIIATGDIEKIADSCFDFSLKSGCCNNFLNEIKLQSWQKILSKLNIKKYLTKSVLEDFENWVKDSGSMELTKENINNVILSLIQNRGEIMKQAVLDVFDIFTKYYNQNRCHIEGWKTNDFWKVNKKIILPYYTELGYNGYYHYSYHRDREYSDIEKVMCYLSGINYDELIQYSDHYKKYMESMAVGNKTKPPRISLKLAIHQTKIGNSDLQDSEFFQIRCYKKGTVHLYFKDEALWEKFNKMACEYKNWLGGEL